MRRIQLACSLTIALLLSATASFAQNFRILDPAYVSKAPQDVPPFLHWDLREMPSCRVPWVLGTAPVIDLDGNFIPDEAADRASFQAVIQGAFSRWDAVLPSDLGFINTPGGAIPFGGFVVDGYNTVIFDAVTLPTATIAAVFLTSNALTGQIIESDMIFNSAVNVPFYGNRQFVQQGNGTSVSADVDYPPYFNWPTPADGDTDVNGNLIQEWNVDMLTVACHEAGHFIGVAHIDPLGGAFNSPANSVMEQFWFIPLGPTGGGWANQTLKLQDRDAENFLYTPDLGDAPDPWMGIPGQYPTLVHRPLTGRTLNGILLDGIAPGAEHILGIKPRNAIRNWTYEWLGRLDNANVDGECEANVVDLDQFDDGVTFYPNPPVWGRALTVTSWVRNANDHVGNFHNYGVTPLWANAWIDLNQDGVWDPFLPEWFMSNVVVPAPLVGANAVGVTPSSATMFLPPGVPNPSLPVWLRARLDWGEDVGLLANIDGTLAASAGAAQFGEVEDYPLWCNRRYETQWVRFNEFINDGRGMRQVYAGSPDPLDQLYGAEVDANDCVIQLVQPSDQYTVYGGADETTHDFILPGYLSNGQYMHVGKCRTTTVNGSLTLLRSYWFPDFYAPGTYSPPPSSTAFNYRIPSVNVGYCLVGPSASPNGMLVTVGAVDIANGGWLEPQPDVAASRENAASPPGGWSDTLRVSVSYRVASGIVPITGLSPCDPAYAALPQVSVGTGDVTPEDGLEFMLSMPSSIAPGQSLIVDVESSWSTNSTVNRQLIEFPLPAGGSTPVDDTRTPKQLGLDSYPNPFNPATTIRFALPKSETVSLAVYDVTGRLVRTLLHNTRKPSGFFESEWNGTDANGKQVVSGVYFFRLTTSTETLTRKAVLLK